MVLVAGVITRALQKNSGCKEKKESGRQSQSLRLYSTHTRHTHTHTGAMVSDRWRVHSARVRSRAALVWVQMEGDCCKSVASLRPLNESSQRQFDTAESSAISPHIARQTGRIDRAHRR